MLINDPAKSTLVLRKYLKECKINPFFCHEISFKQSISALVKKRCARAHAHQKKPRSRSRS